MIKQNKSALKNIGQAITYPFKMILILFIRFYQLVISPLTTPSCRFHPTCSSYALQALTKHGLIKGGYLFLKRFIKCNPWGPHGHDPVPDKFCWYISKKTCKKQHQQKNNKNKETIKNVTISNR